MPGGGRPPLLHGGRATGPALERRAARACGRSARICGSAHAPASYTHLCNSARQNDGDASASPPVAGSLHLTPAGSPQTVKITLAGSPPDHFGSVSPDQSHGRLPPDQNRVPSDRIHTIKLCICQRADSLQKSWLLYTKIMIKIQKHETRRGTCPPLSSSPHAHSFVLGTAVINNN